MTSQQSELLAEAVASYQQRMEQTARCWKLPNWEEYSDCALSDIVHGDNWSDVEADVSFETASQVSSSASLQELHSQYERRREDAEERWRTQRLENCRHDLQARENHSDGAPSTPKSLTPRETSAQLPAAAAPVVSRSPWRRPANESALAAQNAVLNMQLLSVRKQLTDLQDRVAYQSATADDKPTPFSAGATSNPSPKASPAAALPQTKPQSQELVEKWLSLITQKIELVAANGLFTPPSQVAKTFTSMLRDWHAGDSLQSLMLSQSTCEKFVQLERALTQLLSSVDKYSQRQLTHFERSVRQIQGFHHERLQKVVDESLAEMKQIRGKYKKKQDTMEEELRTAAKTVDQWRQKAIEASQESVQLREAMHTPLSQDQFQEEIKRNHHDLEVMERRVETLQMEKEDMTKRYAGVLEDRELKIHELKQTQQQYDMLQALHKDQVSILEKERNEWRNALEQSRHHSELMAKEIRDQTTFAEQLIKQHERDRDTLQAQVKQDVETLFWKAIIPETLQTVQRDHAAELDALRKEWELKIANVRTAAEARTASTAIDYRSVGTQTDPSRMLPPPSPHKDDARVEELKRRCRSLERLLNKKFEEGSVSDPLRTSYQSTRSLPSGKTSPMTLNTSRHSVLKKPSAEDRLDTSTHDSLDDTLYVDTSTRTHVDMWDTASFSSMDSVAPITPARERRPRTPRTPSTPGRPKSTADVLKLLQKLKRIESGNNSVEEDEDDGHEPEPEYNAKRQTNGKSRGISRLALSNRGSTKGSIYG